MPAAEVVVLRLSADAELDTYNHLSSEELWDGALHTSAFHFVLNIVQQLNKTQHHGQNNAHYSTLSMATLFRHLMKTLPLPKSETGAEKGNLVQNRLLKNDFTSYPSEKS